MKYKNILGIILMIMILSMIIVVMVDNVEATSGYYRLNINMRVTRWSGCCDDVPRATRGRAYLNGTRIIDSGLSQGNNHFNFIINYDINKLRFVTQGGAGLGWAEDVYPIFRIYKGNELIASGSGEGIHVLNLLCPRPSLISMCNTTYNRGDMGIITYHIASNEWDINDQYRIMVGYDSGVGFIAERNIDISGVQSRSIWLNMLDTMGLGSKEVVLYRAIDYFGVVTGWRELARTSFVLNERVVSPPFGMGHFEIGDDNWQFKVGDTMGSEHNPIRIGSSVIYITDIFYYGGIDLGVGVDVKFLSDGVLLETFNDVMFTENRFMRFYVRNMNATSGNIEVRIYGGVLVQEQLFRDMHTFPTIVAPPGAVPPFIGPLLPPHDPTPPDVPVAPPGEPPVIPPGEPPVVPPEEPPVVPPEEPPVVPPVDGMLSSISLCNITYYHGDRGIITYYISDNEWDINDQYRVRVGHDTGLGFVVERNIDISGVQSRSIWLDMIDTMALGNKEVRLYRAVDFFGIITQWRELARTTFVLNERFVPPPLETTYFGIGDDNWQFEVGNITGSEHNPIVIGNPVIYITDIFYYGGIGLGFDSIVDVEFLSDGVLLETFNDVTFTENRFMRFTVRNTNATSGNIEVRIYGGVLIQEQLFRDIHTFPTTVAPPGSSPPFIGPLPPPHDPTPPEIPAIPPTEPPVSPPIDIPDEPIIEPPVGAEFDFIINDTFINAYQHGVLISDANPINQNIPSTMHINIFNNMNRSVVVDNIIFSSGGLFLKEYTDVNFNADSFNLFNFDVNRISFCGEIKITIRHDGIRLLQYRYNFPVALHGPAPPPTIVHDVYIGDDDIIVIQEDNFVTSTNPMVLGKPVSIIVNVHNRGSSIVIDRINFLLGGSDKEFYNTIISANTFKRLEWNINSVTCNELEIKVYSDGLIFTKKYNITYSETFDIFNDTMPMMPELEIMRYVRLPSVSRPCLLHIPSSIQTLAKWYFDFIDILYEVMFIAIMGIIMIVLALISWFIELNSVFLIMANSIVVLLDTGILMDMLTTINKILSHGSIALVMTFGFMMMCFRVLMRM